MTITVHAWFTREGPTVIRTPEDVAAFCDEVRQASKSHEVPLFTSWGIAEEDGDDAPELGVGFWGDSGVVSYSGLSWNDLYFSTGADPSEATEYDYQGHERPVPANSLIPYTDIVAAGCEFLLLGGGRPGSVRWQTFE